MKTNDTKAEKFIIQDNQYSFPRHYIPYIDNNAIINYRNLNWGRKYMTYILHCKDIVLESSAKSVLDVGCGDGRFLNILYELDNTKTLKGVDLSEKAIAFAKAFSDGAEFEVADIADMHESFDVVTAIEVLEHIPDDLVSAFINGLENNLAASGHIVISVPMNNIPVSKKHYRHYDLELFERQIEEARCGLEIVRVDYLYKKNNIIEKIEKILKNKYWFIDFKFLNRPFWNYVQKRVKNCDKDEASIMIVVLRKRQA